MEEGRGGRWRRRRRDEGEGGGKTKRGGKTKGGGKREEERGKGWEGKGEGVLISTRISIVSTK